MFGVGPCRGIEGAILISLMSERETSAAGEAPVAEAAPNNPPDHSPEDERRAEAAGSWRRRLREGTGLTLRGLTSRMGASRKVKLRGARPD
jgi:hypothetical protein